MTPLQGGFSAGGFGCALAGGDDDDGGVDRQASGDGNARGYLNHLLYRRRKLGGEYPISRTDPFVLTETFYRLTVCTNG